MEATILRCSTGRALKTGRGHCRPFGATPGPDGINFAIFSRHADRVSLLLFERDRRGVFAEIGLDPHLNKTGDIWHIFVHGLRTDTLYGYRMFGPLVPERGHRFDPERILIDPYALGLAGGEVWGLRDDPIEGHTELIARKGRIVRHDFDWEEDIPLNIPMGETLIYELHVRGFTYHPTSGVEYPGTFDALSAKIPYLKRLGVTAVELMPALDFDECDQVRANPRTGERLINFWGYSPVSFFAPKAAYAANPRAPVREFKRMVREFHRAGIEVILDVVYNHTCEGDERGPTLCFRGLDNSIYYMLDRLGRYYNFSGCGNTFNCNHPLVRDLIVESLSYLVTELHVDGFRFDLAAILGRGTDGRVLENPPLIEHIAEHPVLAGVKLIAEAWDAAGLSQLGKFPAWGRWAELNGVFRDDARRFLRGDPEAIAGIASRICGSLDIYGDSSRHPYHSVNFITCHDGFTLHDLVSYDEKHNLENGESNADGIHDNLSSNYGVEGPTTDPEIVATRQRQMRNALVLLLTSQGVPFLLGGDELGRTQRGNNNAFCQDNAVSWLDWSLMETNAGLLRFTQMMIALRKQYFALSREQFCARVTWHGERVGKPDWSGQSRTLAFHLRGWQEGPDLYVIYNSHWKRRSFQLPPAKGQWKWRRIVDTNLASPDDIVDDQDGVWLNPQHEYVCIPRSSVILVADP